MSERAMTYCVKVFMVIAALSSIYESTYGQSIGFGSCPDVSVLSTFDASKYTGRWYEAERIPDRFDLGVSCVTTDYSAETYMFFRHTGNLLVTIDWRDRSGQVSSMNGKLVPLDKSSKEAKYWLSYNGSLRSGPYWVLDTDYNTYSVVYSCKSLLGLLNLKYVFLLTRESVTPQYALDHLKSVLQKNDLSSILPDLTTVNQKNCQYT